VSKFGYNNMRLWHKKSKEKGHSFQSCNISSNKRKIKSETNLKQAGGSIASEKGTHKPRRAMDSAAYPGSEGADGRSGRR
jgi:hypothetical protein